MRETKNYFLLLLLTMLVACNSSEDEIQHVTISNLVGLWDSSEKNEAKTDVMYTRISSTGDIIEYDYDGDELDKGLNCYQINTGKIIPIKESFFLITNDMQKDQKFEVELELLDSGHALKIYFLGSSDESAQSSDGKNIKSSQIWTRMRNSSALDNESSCSEK